MNIELATEKMKAYCAYQERCHKEVKEKLFKLELYGDDADEIIITLIQDNFLNEERFAKAQVRGKFRIKKWGKERIIRELKFKLISEYNIISALNEIDENEYYTTFNELAIKRLSELKELNKYKKQKRHY